MEIYMKIIITILLLSASTISSYANELHKSQHTFNAKVSNVRLNALLISQGKKPTDQVSTNLSAVIFEQPMNIQDVRSFTPKSTVAEIDTLIRYSKANIEGSVQDIVSFWSPEERAKKTELLARPDIFKANREYSQKNPNLVILGLVYQSGSSSILLKKHNRVIGVSFHMKNNQLFLTDKPSNDLELAIVEASYSNE
jgi:hypothetical protein